MFIKNVIYFVIASALYCLYYFYLSKIFPSYGTAILSTLLVTLLLTYVCFNEKRRLKTIFIGGISRNDAIVGFTLVSSCVIGFVVIEKLLGIGEDNGMKVFTFLFFTNTLYTISLMMFAPVWEELIFRFFSMNIFMGDRRSEIIGVILTSFIFMLIHRDQYEYIILFQIFCYGVIFGWARVKTNGLLLPIALHAQAIIFGFTINYFVYY